MGRRGAFVDEKGVRWDTNNADYEGILLKKSRWIGEWRKRYLILKGSKLFFSKDVDAPPHGMIDLVDCVSVKSAESKSSKRYALEVELKNESFLMSAKNEKEKDEWVSRISKAIMHYSNLYFDDYKDDQEDYDEDEIEQAHS